MLSGRVVDAQGNPVAGARVSVEGNGFYGEFFKATEPLTQMPDLTNRRPDAAHLVAGLSWLNPQNVFGADPMGLGMALAFAARYTARLLVPQDGQYAFVTQAQAEALVLIDGQTVAGNVTLSAGAHRIEVQYYASGEPVTLQLSWVPPDGVQRPIPPEALVASDPALRGVSEADGSFQIQGVPAKLGQVRVRIELPDGRTGTSAWTTPLNGGVTIAGDIAVLDQVQGQKQQ